MANGATTNCHKRVLYVNSSVLVGGRKATHTLANWPCLQCGESNGSQLGVCHGKNCKGLPLPEYMGKQAALQAKWRAENAMVPGAAPYVAANGRRRKPATASPKDSGNDDLAKKLRASEAERKKLATQLKQQTAPKPHDAKAPASDEAKALEKKVKRL